jgi:hypothetical protein
MSATHVVTRATDTVAPRRRCEVLWGAFESVMVSIRVGPAGRFAAPRRRHPW